MQACVVCVRALEGRGGVVAKVENHLKRTSSIFILEIGFIKPIWLK